MNAIYVDTHACVWTQHENGAYDTVLNRAKQHEMHKIHYIL